jgi:hypothetical protein
MQVAHPGMTMAVLKGRLGELTVAFVKLPLLPNER